MTAVPARGSSARLSVALSAVLVAIAIAGLWVGTQHGPGATPDSATYASVAENLSTGRGLTIYDGSELTLFPPGLAVLLAAFEPFGLPPPAAARIVNAVSLAAVILLGGIMLQRNVEDQRIRAAGLALIALSPVLILVSVMLWSDIPFVAVTLGFLLVFERAMRQRGMTVLIGAAALAGAAFLLRYPGFALIGFGAAVLGWRAVHRRTGEDVGRLAMFTSIALLPVVAWLLHNRAYGAVLSAASGSPLEDRTLPGQGFLANVWQVVQTLGSWLVPRGEVLAIGAVIGLSVVGVLLRRPTGPPRLSPGVAYLGGFSLFYLAVVIVGATITKVDLLDDRLLSPVYVPSLVLLLVGVERVFASVIGQRRLGMVVLAAVVVWSVYPAVTWIGRVQTASEGVAFASAQWRESALIGLLRDSGDTSPLYTNWPDGAYYAASVQPARFGPADDGPGLAEFTSAVHCTGPVRFAEFVYGRPFLLAPYDFGPGLSVEVSEEVADGTLYRVSAAGEATGVDCTLAAHLLGRQGN